MSQGMLEEPAEDYVPAAASRPLQDVRIIAVEQYGAGT
jgi:hypothetical protein